MNNELDSRFLAARRNYIASRFSMLNDVQREAVLTTEGPLLLLAGAGSGKTTVLINRIANILRYGRGSEGTEIPDFVRDEDVTFLENLPEDPTQEQTDRADWLCALEPANPWNVIAITFTNKAAGEMKERLSNMLGASAEDIWAMTFHAACCRILRRYIDRCGYTSSFTIYDTSDSERLMKEILRDMNLDDKTYPPRYVLSIIGRQKDRLISPEQMEEDSRSASDYRIVQIAKAYAVYQKRLKDNNALDFDDILFVTVKLLQQDREVREYYQRKFHYVLVDEYQDTNHVQYLLTELLAGDRRNICVVGDDDQSIYRFRGADITNILSFEQRYKNARTIRLEQNYRSTQNILDAANAVIRNNQGRKGKTLWTQNGAGDPVTIKTCYNESDEANFVVGDIMSRYNQGANWRDNAILYRMNAQSNALEYAFKRNAVPYKIVGGVKFFDRAEVKDMLAYLCVICNPADDLRLRRIINVPSRKIGGASLEKAQAIAAAEGRPLFDIIRVARKYPELKSAAGRMEDFGQLIMELRSLCDELELVEFYGRVCQMSGYVQMLQEKNDMESRGRLENVQELASSISAFLESDPDDPSLAGFLNDVALYTDLDGQSDSDNCVTLMTMHSAKGLEFDHVYVTGMDEGVFPGNRAMGEQEEMEEERRLCYVAMTRARKTLTMTNVRQRMLFGQTEPKMPSRFLEEIPAENMRWLGKPEPRKALQWDDNWNDGWSGGWGSTTRGTYKTQEVKQQTRQKPLQNSAATRRAPAAASAPLMQLSAGDQVRHSAFGQGMVLSVRPMGGDALIEVAFDKVGTKKLMLKAAGAHLTKL